MIETICTCDDEDTTVDVDMGYECGGVVSMCTHCYDFMMSEGDE